MPGSGRSASGKVDWFWIGENYCHVSVDGHFIVLWGPADPRPLSSFEWVSMIRDSIKYDLEVSILYTDDLPYDILRVALYSNNYFA